MPVRIRLGQIAGIALLSLTIVPNTFGAPVEPPAPGQSASTPSSIDSQAEAAERAGLWDRALELYLRAFVCGRQSPDIRDKIRECFRHVSQIRRQRDPGFQQFVVNLSPADALNLYCEVLGSLQSRHAERQRASTERLFNYGLDEFMRAIADRTFRQSHFASASDAAITKFLRQLETSGRTRSLKTPREARQTVFDIASQAQQILGIRTPSVVIFEFICGACQGLDEYTTYLAPTPTITDISSAIHEFAAYGIHIRLHMDALIVDEIAADSWAMSNTTLTAGDRIVRINGRSMTSATLQAAADALRIPADSGHEIEIVSASRARITLRLPTPVPSVARAELLSMKESIGYIRLNGIRPTSPAEFDEAMARLHGRGMRALILDLRGNTGGSFQSGVQLAQRFLPSGIIVTTQGQAPEFQNRVFSSDSGMSAWDLPLVVLVDARTMSAAEIMACALKDHNRATLVGMPTFGKGAIQHQFPLRSLDEIDDMGMMRTRSGALIITIARAISPRGTAIHGVGVSPHLIDADPQRQLGLAIERAGELLMGR